MIDPGVVLLSQAIVEMVKNPNLSTLGAEVRVGMVIEKFFRIRSGGLSQASDRAGSLSGTPQAPGVGAGLQNNLKGT